MNCDSLFLATALILSGDVQNTIGVNIKGSVGSGRTRLGDKSGGTVDIGDGQGATGGEDRIGLGQVDHGRSDDGGVIGAGDGDRLGLGDRRALGVLDQEADRDGLRDARGQVVEGLQVAGVGQVAKKSLESYFTFGFAAILE